MSILVSLWLVIKRLEISKLDNVVWYFSVNYFSFCFFFIKKAATIEGERKKQKASIKSNTLDSEESSTLLTTCCFRLQEYDIVCSFFSHLITNSSDVFTSFFHQFFPRIFLSFWELKKKLLAGPKQLFFSVYQLKKKS